MKISFVIPVVSFRPILWETLRSITTLEGLDPENYEVLIIQNGPRDLVAGWITKNPTFRCIHGPEKSIPKARNLGIELSFGEYIAFLDEDSICPAGWLHEALSYFQSRNVGAYQSPSKHKNEIICFEENYLNSSEFDGIILFDTAASLFRREALIDVGGFDETFKRVEDLDIGMKLSRRGWILVFGSIVIEGEDSSFFRSILTKCQSAYHSKRLHLKYKIPTTTKLFAPGFKLMGKRTKFGGSFERLLFYLIRPKHVAPFDLKKRLRFGMIFLDQEGKSYLLKNRFSLLLTQQTVLILIDWRLILTSNDPYFYRLVSHSDKLVTVEMSQIEDQEFLKKLSTHFIRENGPASLS